MGELIIYENDMNKLKFGNFTKVSMNFFMALCFFMKNKGTTHFQISFDELKERSNYRPAKDHDFIHDLDYMTDQMLEVNSTIIEKKPSGKKRIYKFDLFPTFVIDEDTETLEVAVNERFTWLLNEFNHYTSIDLEEIVGFKSKYTKNLFRLIRQWKSKGELRISGTASIQEFREKIGVKDTYSNAEMNRRCLAPSVQEINDSNCSIHNLSYELEYANKRGKPLKAILFKWDRVLGENNNKVSDITTESIYDAVKDILNGKLEIKEDDIIAIAKAAKKNGISEDAAVKRIQYTLPRISLGYIANPTGYMISLMQKFSSPTEIKKKLGGFNDFENKRDRSKEEWAELEKILLEDSNAYFEEHANEHKKDDTVKLMDLLEKNNMSEEKAKDNESTQESLKKLLDIMKNTTDKD